MILVKSDIRSVKHMMMVRESKRGSGWKYNEEALLRETDVGATTGDIYMYICMRYILSLSWKVSLSDYSPRPRTMTRWQPAKSIVRPRTYPHSVIVTRRLIMIVSCVVSAAATAESDRIRWSDDVTEMKDLFFVVEHFHLLIFLLFLFEALLYLYLIFVSVESAVYTCKSSTKNNQSMCVADAQLL